MSLSMVHKPGCTTPDVVALCQCEANVTCKTCGWGRGAIPCKCSPSAVPLEAVSPTEGMES